MRRILFIVCVMFMVQAAIAQPARRRTEQQASRQTRTTDLTTRAQIAFPTSAKMSEDVVWRRDIYRELDLMQDRNAGLYYPVEPIGSQVNLFTYIFKLVMHGQVSAYEYKLDGNESFDDASRVKPLSLLDNYHIYYERTDKGVRIDDSDIPSREVTAYYIKESAYYDQSTSSFHTKVLALCPIMKRTDDFGDGTTPYPLFWVKYDDLAPFLAKQTIMTSNLNNAATMSVDDYFVTNQYQGKIYKTNNMLGKTLAQYCESEEAMSAEQKRIEAELAEFEKSVWGNNQQKDSLDSIAVADKGAKKSVRKASRRSGNSNQSVRSRRSSGNSSSSGSSSARVTVRRERH